MRDEWGAGNPLKSIVVKNLKKGQANDAKEKGYRQKSARPWNVAEMHIVMNNVEEQLISCNRGIPQLLVLRGALILAPLWQTHSRGNNAGIWRLANIKLPTGEWLAVGESVAAGGAKQ